MVTLRLTAIPKNIQRATEEPAIAVKIPVDQSLPTIGEPPASGSLDLDGDSDFSGGITGRGLDESAGANEITLRDGEGTIIGISGDEDGIEGVAEGNTIKQNSKNE